MLLSNFTQEHNILDRNPAVEAIRDMSPKPVQRVEQGECGRLAASGGSVSAAVQGQVVAASVPPEFDGSPMLVDGVPADAAHQGRLTPPLLGASGVPRSPASVAPFETLLAELEGDRRDR